jgi:K+-sensing histidine kinase KdpD
VQGVFFGTLAVLALSTVIGIVTAVRARRAAAEVQKELQRLEAEAQRNMALAEEKYTKTLSKLSHDLRTPLGTIVGWAQVLRAQNPPEQMLHALEVIERNARAQTRIIQELLDDKKATPGSVAPQSPGPSPNPVPPPAHQAPGL